MFTFFKRTVWLYTANWLLVLKLHKLLTFYSRRCSLKVPLQSRNMLFGFISVLEMVCLEQNYVSLDAIARAVPVLNGTRMVTISQLWIWCRLTSKGILAVCSSERGGKTGLILCFLLPLELHRSRDAEQRYGKQHATSRRAFSGTNFQIAVSCASVSYLDDKLCSGWKYAVMRLQSCNFSWGGTLNSGLTVWQKLVGTRNIHET